MYSFTAPGGLSGDDDFVAGLLVTTNQDLLITHAGIWDVNADGLAQDHGYRIYNEDTATDLLNTVFTAGSGTLLNGFRYIDIVDIFVAAGTDLTILSDNRSGVDSNIDRMTFNVSGLSFDPAFTLRQVRFQNNATVSTTLPGSVFSTNVLSGPNLLFSPADAEIPEPSTYALLGLGLAAIMLRRK